MPAGQSKTLKGWFHGGSKFRAFQVVPNEQSVAAEIGSSGGIGVITAAFRRAYLEGETPTKYDEKSVTAGLGTGQGREIVIDVKEEKRTFGRLLTQIPIRYDRPEK